MPYAIHDTICAVASPPGRAARGIVRLSGPQVQAVVARCVEPVAGAWPDPARPSVVAVRVIVPGLPSWWADCYCWPDGRSFTGQPSVELHTLASRPLLEALIHRLVACGARVAQPGEFTLRAFLGGRIDLTQAEAVLGVIDADAPDTLDAALRQLAGGLARPLHALRDDLVDLAVLLETSLDFPDEELPPLPGDAIATRLDAARQAVATLRDTMASRRSAAELPRAVLVGWTNTGKSSLFNTLAGETHAIVAREAGTTRDYLTATVSLDGLPVELVDTAGEEGEAGPTPAALRQPAGDEAARKRHEADLVLFCVDASRSPNVWEADELKRAVPGRLVVLTKSDLPPAWRPSCEVIAVSSRTGEGLRALKQLVRSRLAARGAGTAGVVSATAIRCGDILHRAAEALASAWDTHRLGRGDDLVAVDMRAALDALGEVVGTVYTDDLLDRIFRQFCIGK